MRALADAGHGLYLGHDRDGWRHAAAQHSVSGVAALPRFSGKTIAIHHPQRVFRRKRSGRVDARLPTKPGRSSDSDRLQAPLRLGQCLLFDPTASVDEADGVHRLRWSPVPACLSWRTALATARSLVLVGSAAGGPGAIRGDGSHWTERAAALLAPLLHAAALEGVDMRTVLTWVDRRQALPAQQVLAFQAAGTGDIARNLLDGIVTTDERELSGIWSTASGALGGFRSEEALATTAEPDFDPDRFVRSVDTLYVAAPAHHQALVAPLVVGVLDAIRRAAYARAATGRSESDPPVLLALDELANIAPIPDLPSMVSEGGGQGVVTLACFQDLSQARHRWPEEANGFPSLFGTTVVLPGIGDVRTLEALSVLAGEEELVTRSVSSGRAPSDHVLTDLLSGGRPQVGDQHAHLSGAGVFLPRSSHVGPMDALSRSTTATGRVGCRFPRPTVPSPGARCGRPPGNSTARCTPRPSRGGPPGRSVRRGRSSDGEDRRGCRPAMMTHSTGPRPDPGGPTWSAGPGAGSESEGGCPWAMSSGGSPRPNRRSTWEPSIPCAARSTTSGCSRRERATAAADHASSVGPARSAVAADRADPGVTGPRRARVGCHGRPFDGGRGCALRQGLGERDDQVAPGSPETGGQPTRPAPARDDRGPDGYPGPPSSLSPRPGPGRRGRPRGRGHADATRHATGRRSSCGPSRVVPRGRRPSPCDRGERWTSSSMPAARLENRRHSTGSMPDSSRRPEGPGTQAAPIPTAKAWRSTEW